MTLEHKFKKLILTLQKSGMKRSWRDAQYRLTEIQDGYHPTKFTLNYWNEKYKRAKGIIKLEGLDNGLK